jgi:hypothetical protein
MVDAYAIIYAPGANRAQCKHLLQKLQDKAQRLGFFNSNIDVKFGSEVKIKQRFISKGLITLILGWGLPSEPSWNILLNENSSFDCIRHLFAFDLYERERSDGEILKEPRINAGKYWSQKVQQNHIRLFLNGCYIRTFIPYGMRRIPLKSSTILTSRRKHYTLEPGDPSEIKIVRLIFDLFANHGYNRTEICNLLNAQGVTYTKNNRVWDTKKILTILTTPMYIGANQYGDCIRYDVFPSVIDKTTYFEAQAKIWLFSDFSKDIDIRSRTEKTIFEKFDKIRDD